MLFDLSRPQKLLQRSVRDFCKRECPTKRVRELMETDSAMDGQLWNEIAAQGWIGLHLGEEFDGLGLGLVEVVVVAEQLGRACVPGPWLSTNWAATLMAAVGGPGAAKHLPRIVDGSIQATVAALEEQVTWDLDARAFTTMIDDGHVLNGRKDLVLHAQQAQLIVCVARRGEELCLVLLPANTEGVSVIATPGIDATRKLYQCEFRNVLVQEEQILARDVAAQAAVEISQSVATIAVCAEMLGLMQWMLETTVEYAKTRKQFERTIGSFQAVQHKCADMFLLTESARSAVWYAAWSLEEKTLAAARAVAIAKVYVSDAVREVGNLAVQVHGGIGFTWEHDLHLYYKRAKADEYLFGDASYHREQLAGIVFSGR